MKSEKLMDAIGMLDEGFLEENLEYAQEHRPVVVFRGRVLRNLLAAALALALLGCAVWASTVPENPAPQWDPYAEADTMLDVLFGTQRDTPHEGEVAVRRKLVGKTDEGAARYEEVRIPITSSASREPVSRELAALVKPYSIPVGETVMDPTGTITLEIMAYLYEPKTQCGIVYLKLTDPTGEFCGYVPEKPAMVVEPGEEISKVPRGIECYLNQFPRRWGHSQPESWMLGLRLVEELSDETTWTFAAYFWTDNYDTVDFDIGFQTEPMVNWRPYRIDLDLERTPTMETLVLGNARNKELVTVSPVGILIDGDQISDHWQRASKVVIHFDDGNAYVVIDEENYIYGYSSGAKDCFAFANIVDVRKIQSVEINGIRYYKITW